MCTRPDWRLQKRHAMPKRTSFTSRVLSMGLSNPVGLRLQKIRMLPCLGGVVHGLFLPMQFAGGLVSGGWPGLSWRGETAECQGILVAPIKARERILLAESCA